MVILCDRIWLHSLHTVMINLVSVNSEYRSTELQKFDSLYTLTNYSTLISKSHVTTSSSMTVNWWTAVDWGVILWKIMFQDNCIGCKGLRRMCKHQLYSKVHCYIVFHGYCALCNYWICKCVYLVPNICLVSETIACEFHLLYKWCFYALVFMRNP